MDRRLLALPLAILVAGCSGAGPVPSPSATASSAPTAGPTPSPTAIPSPTVDPLLAVIRAAADATVAGDTADFDYVATFYGSTSIPNGTTLTGTGSLAWSEPLRIKMSANYASIGLGNMLLIADDRKLYVSGAFLQPTIKQGRWLLVDLDSRDPRAARFQTVVSGQNNPALAMYFLYAASGPVVDKGLDVTTTGPVNKYSVVLDLDAAAGQIPASIRESFLDNVAALRAAGMSRQLEAEVWVGTDGYVHHVDYLYHLGPSQGGGALSSQYNLSSIGRPIDLGIPKASLIVRLEDIPLPS